MKITDLKLSEKPRVTKKIDGTEKYEFRIVYRADGKRKDMRGPRAETIKEAKRLALKKMEAIRNTDDSLKVMDMFQTYIEENPTKKKVARFLESRLPQEMKQKSLCDLDYTFGRDFAEMIPGLDLNEEDEWYLDYFKDVFLGIITEAVESEMISMNKYYEIYGAFIESY